MLKFLQSVLNGDRSRSPSGAQSEPIPEPPLSVEAPGAEGLALEPLIQRVSGFPHFDWDAVYQWIDALPEDEQAAAWGRCELAWLAHLRDSLGGDYSLSEAGDAVLLSSVEPNVAKATLEFMTKTESIRVSGVPMKYRNSGRASPSFDRTTATCFRMTWRAFLSIN